MILEYNNEQCKYNIAGIKNLYLVSSYAVKDIRVDTGGEAWIDSIDETPYHIDCHNIQLMEETSLDERYLFHKTVQFVVDGYPERNIFGDRRYVILEYENGVKRMVNVDFPSEVSYNFTIDNDTYETVFIFESYSNFPTLRIDTDFDMVEEACFGYAAIGISALRMNERQNVRLDRANRIMTTNGVDFVDVKGKNITFTEAYSDNVFTDTLSFLIPIDDYKSSWHYNLLEFKRNIYSALLIPKSNVNNIFIGFNEGLQPNYSIGDDGITVTLTESSNTGALALYDFTEEMKALHSWVYTTRYEDIEISVCVGNGTGMYVIQKEVDGFGNPTDRYKAYSGWTEYLESLGADVVGEFTEIATFFSPSCYTDECNIVTNMPSAINFVGTGCTSYDIMSTCDWNVENVPSQLSITPTSGAANSAYTITVCNNSTSSLNDSFDIVSNTTNKTVTVTVGGSAFVTPNSQTINCLAQDVVFFYDPSCEVTFVGDASLSFTYGNGKVTVSVPQNETTSSRTFYITATNCKGDVQTVTIIQNQRYEEWRNLNNDYICDTGAKYQLLTLFTGTTSTNLVETDIKKRGRAIEGDDECSIKYFRWVFDGSYTCVDGDKYEIEEEEKSYDEVNWVKTGEIRIGQLAEQGATAFCNSRETRWVLSSDFICEKDADTPTPEVIYKATVYGNGASYGIVENNSGTITQAEVRGLDIPYSSITSVSISDSVTSISENAFKGCSSLEMVIVNNRINTIGDNAFQNCTSLTSFTMTDSVRTVGDAVFYGCSSLSSLRISPYINVIGESMCENCHNLGFITIPFAVQTIGNFAFSNCSSLFITMENYQPCTLDLGASQDYHHFDAVRSIAVPGRSMSTYSNATGWSEYQSKLVGI